MDVLLLKVTVLLGAAALGAWALRWTSAAVRHALWSATFVSVLTLPLLSWTAPTIGIPVATQDALPAPMDAEPEPTASLDAVQRFGEQPIHPAAVQTRTSTVASPVPVVAPAGRAEIPVASARATARWWPRAAVADVAFAVWLTGFLAALTAIVVSLVRVRRIAAAADDVVDADWREALVRVSAAFGRRPARLVVSQSVAVPMAGGVWRPTIFLPPAARDWPADHRDVVLAHETAHLASWDPLRHLVARLALAVYWFHPLAWLAARQANAACEQACDQTVVSCGVRPSTYARVLLALAKSAARRGRPLAALPIVSRSWFERRLMAILDDEPRRPRRGLAAMAVVAVLLSTGAVGPLALVTVAQPEVESAVTWESTEIPWPATRNEETDASQTASPLGAISGVVIDSVTKRPVRGAIVTLGPAVLIGTGTRQLTDDRGRFIFLDLPAAENYSLAAAKAGYLDRSNVVRPRQIALAPRQWLQNQTLEVIPEGSISGTVRDERGEPVVGARVRLLALVPVAGRVRAVGGFVATTDDRGVYRIAGLPTGRYLISVPSVQHTVPADTPPAVVAGRAVAQVTSAGPRAAASGAVRTALDVAGRWRVVIDGYVTPPAPDADGRTRIYPPTFHPQAVSIADAAPVALAAGQQREGVDVQLQPVPAWRVSGQVTGSASPAGLPLRLLRAGDDDLGLGGEVATTLVEADGRFTFLNVPAGRHVVDLRPSLVAPRFSPRNMFGDYGDPLPTPPGFGAAAGSSSIGSVDGAPAGVSYAASSGAWDQTVWARTEVDVGDRDVNVVVPLLRPSRLTGRVLWERRSETPLPSAPAPAPNTPVSVQTGMQQTLVRAVGADGAPGLGTLTAVVGADNTFTLDGLLPGEYVLRVRGPFGAGFSVKSITWKGADFTHAGFDVSAPADVSGVTIMLTDDTQSVAGVVSGLPPGGDGAAVIAFPVDPNRWTNYGPQPVLIRSVEASATGRYELALPAGDFHLIAVDRSQARAWTDPAFLVAAARVATRVSLGWGEKKAQDLRFAEVAR
jgi:beta-lactamase regulating signal transducer with metallopeptidase domain